MVEPNPIQGQLLVLVKEGLKIVMKREPEFEHKPELQYMFSWIVPGMH